MCYCMLLQQAQLELWEVEAFWIDFARLIATYLDHSSNIKQPIPKASILASSLPHLFAPEERLTCSSEC